MRVFNERHVHRLEDQLSAAEAAWGAARDRLDVLREELRIESLTLWRERERYPEDSMQVAAVRTFVEGKQLKVDRQAAIVQRLVEPRVAFNSVLRSVQTYVAEQQLRPARTNEEANYPKPAVSILQVRKSVEKARDEIAALNVQRAEIEGLHVSIEIARQRILLEFEAAQNYSRLPGVVDVVQRRGTAVGLVMREMDGTSVRGGPTTFAAFNPAFIVPAVVKLAREHFDREIAAFYQKAGPGISDADRAAKLKQIDVQKFALEEKEEALIRMAEDDGQTIFRRPDADPAAILGPIFDEQGLQDEPYVSRAVEHRFPGKERASAPPAYRDGLLTTVNKTPGFGLG